jgi:hypothetical protein
MIKPKMVVMRAESFPREEKREVRNDTARPMQPGEIITNINCEAC